MSHYARYPDWPSCTLFSMWIGLGSVFSQPATFARLSGKRVAGSWLNRGGERREEFTVLFILAVHLLGNLSARFMDTRVIVWSKQCSYWSLATANISFKYKCIRTHAREHARTHARTRTHYATTLNCII